MVLNYLFCFIDRGLLRERGRERYKNTAANLKWFKNIALKWHAHRVIKWKGLIHGIVKVIPVSRDSRNMHLFYHLICKHINIKISVSYSCENLEKKGGGVAGSSPLENSLITLYLTSALGHRTKPCWTSLCDFTRRWN